MGFPGVTGTDSRRRSHGVIMLLLFILSVSILFYKAVLLIWGSWHRDEYSYGIFIPFIALMLLLNKMEDARLRPHASWLGFVIVSGCAVLQFLLDKGGVRGVLPEIYLLCLAGVVLLFWGAKSLRPLAGPLAFLMFAAPLPRGAYGNLSVEMQMLSTSLGTKLLEALNIPVFQDGNIIDLGGYKLQVAEACSGLRYLFPLLALSFLLAYMYTASLLKKAVLFLSAAPIAILMNGLRIAVIGITVDRWGSQMAEGMLHEVEGWMVFLGCTVCLLIEIRVFKWFGHKGTLDFDCLRLPRSLRAVAPATGTPTYACAAVIAAALLIGISVPDVSRPVPLKAPFTVFPLKVGPWIGHFGSMDAASLAVLGTNDYVLADYVKPDSPPVNLYALYYAEQDNTSNEAVHTPAGCIPGGGWTIDSGALKSLALEGGGSLSVHKLVVSKDNVRKIVYYWYIVGGRAESDIYVLKLYQMRDAIMRGTTNGAMVRLMTQITGGETEEAAERRLNDFLRASLGVLNGFMFPAAEGGVP